MALQQTLDEDVLEIIWLEMDNKNESLYEFDTKHTNSKNHSVSVFLHTHVVIPLAEYSINVVKGKQKNVDKRRSLLGISY